MLSVTLLSFLMILLFTLSVIRHLIYGNNYNWLLNLNLIYETLWTGAGSGLLISMLEKLNWFCLTGLITTGAICYWCKNRWVCSWRKIIFYNAGVDFLLNWIVARTLSLLIKLSRKRSELRFLLWNFFSVYISYKTSFSIKSFYCWSPKEWW